MPDPDLRAICTVWQERLRLRDWTFDIDWARKHGDLSADSYAKTTWTPSEMHAYVLIRRPESMQRKFKRAPIEQTVVHEMLHVKLEGFTEENEALHVPQYEAAIDNLAEAYIAAYGPIL